MPKNAPPANRPETYLNPTERAQVARLLGFPEEFPQKFIAWLDDHLKVNVPQFPVTQIRGFQDFKTTVQQFLLGEGPSWPFIQEKGDLIVGFEPKTVTILPPPGFDDYVLVTNDAEPSGLQWIPASAISAIAGAKELAVVFSAPSQAVSANTAMAIGISAILAPLDIVAVRAFVTTTGSSSTVVDSAFLSTPITIPSGDNWDNEAAVIGTPGVSVEQIKTLTVTSAGTGAKGLQVIVTFG